MRTQHLFVYALYFCTAAATMETASAQAQSGLGGPPDLTFRGPRMGFVTASETTRGFFVGQTCPFQLAMPALPAGASEVATLASWNYLLDGALPANNVIGVNGNAVIGGLAGDGDPDLGWGKDRGANYVANVTGLVLHGNNNVIAGICDGPLGADPMALGEGVTLITVYQFPQGPDHEVDIWTGYTSTESNGAGAALANLDFTTEYRFNTAQFFVNALDGQLMNGDGLFINMNAVSGVLPGTNALGNAWIGLLGPLVDENLYDAGEGDVSAYLAWGDTSLGFRTLGNGDTIAHTLAAFAHQVECGDTTVYCTAKVNSLGCTPQISTIGAPHETGGGPFLINASSIINNKNGILFYGFASTASPFQGGTLCVKAPHTRTLVQTSGGNPPPNDCSGTFSFDFQALIQGGTDPQLVAGESVFAQYWSRDPNDAFTTNTTDAVAFDICP